MKNDLKTCILSICYLLTLSKRYLKTNPIFSWKQDRYIFALKIHLKTQSYLVLLKLKKFKNDFVLIASRICPVDQTPYTLHHIMHVYSLLQISDMPFISI